MLDKEVLCDLKIGTPINGNIVSYARVGLTASWPHIRLHYGGGIEYKYAKAWSAAGEYSGDTSSYQRTAAPSTTSKSRCKRARRWASRKRRTWFAGVRTGYGFHGDGLKSALRVAADFNAAPGWTRL
ncbi:hypothetical protein [Paraburkholderia sp. SG-MS1]|uniref:hypothetical protein n=1 Tax=Paraburkholderia sp. SG-MS1 TaxID=2023741 RepID=UPI0014476A2C|nr:hypothetical protein [Paraburkholderia sp. SG-MS1]